MHPKNRYLNKHDFGELTALEPELDRYIIEVPGDRTSLDFTNPRAVYLLNRTLLRRDYGLDHWDIPAGNLTPAVPGRLDYVHALAELAPEANRVLDIGTGASLIYPVLGVREYGWSFVATDIDPRSLLVARAIVEYNRGLQAIEIREQPNPKHIFRNIIGAGDHFDLSMCNPPFYSSCSEANSASRKKWATLGRGNHGRSFAGSENELHTPGGEAKFLTGMIAESACFSEQVGWFTTLVSKKGYLSSARSQLKGLAVAEHRTIRLAQGNKRMRILAWRF